ncbi:hypothetical protein TNCT_514001 [Trichonephila clavata]|uniref:Uncharacterized protein n=1 Tax=Trichonephila clavata TaxID=2740835 RepID=A0A8X6M2C2_TRICU|nr:hypothetical protein TNCT_514001 [Trichonephila clavata]
MIVGARLSEASVMEAANLLGLARSTVSAIMKAYTKKGTVKDHMDGVVPGMTDMLQNAKENAMGVMDDIQTLIRQKRSELW